MPVLWLLTLLGLSAISTAKAFQDTAFAIPIDPTDYYIRVGKNFTRNPDGRITCAGRPETCLKLNEISVPSTGSPLCITGKWNPSGPKGHGLRQWEYDYANVTKDDTWCWDQVVRPNRGRLHSLIDDDRHSFSQLWELDGLKIIMEPDIPSG